MFILKDVSLKAASPGGGDGGGGGCRHNTHITQTYRLVRLSGTPRPHAAPDWNQNQFPPPPAPAKSLLSTQDEWKWEEGTTVVEGLCLLGSILWYHRAWLGDHARLYSAPLSLSLSPRVAVQPFTARFFL